MRELATKLKSRTKHGEKNVFVSVELDKFLPCYCPEARAVPLTVDGAGEGKDRKNLRRLEFALWGMAWEGYALAAAALEQARCVVLSDPIFRPRVARIFSDRCHSIPP